MRNRTRKRKQANRGVVLLIVLTLLVLFTLLMVTFVIVAGQYKTAAQAMSRVEVDDRSSLVDMGINMLIRDTPDSRSVIRGHSLLLDLYGLDGFKGTIQTVGNVGVAAAGSDGTSRQFFDIWLKTAPPSELQDLTGAPYTLSDIDGYYAGRILTPVDGDTAGQSMRIVAYSRTGTFFRVMTTRGADVTIRPQPGDRVVVGGQPFNGTGFGYDTGAGGRPTKLSTEALLPNRQGDSGATLLQYLIGSPSLGTESGPDESYDAVDFQNMALAGIIPTTSTNVVDNHVILPSFHRPSLIQYASSSGSWASMRDRVVMRPMPWNHPNFDGSNPHLSGATHTTAELISLLGGIEPGSSPPRWINPWDVDNDRDGIKDSIWVDLNAPLRQMPNGRLARPLYAFLCVDLDGKLNLNASGNLTQLNTLNTDAIYGIAAASPATPASRPVTDTRRLTRNQPTVSLPEGGGLGAAEIYLGTILNNTLPSVVSLPSPPRPQNEYERLLRGDETRQILGRYGSDQLPGVSGMDTLANIRFFEFPARYFNPLAAPGTLRNAFGSPSDLFGELALGLDHRGQPSYDQPNSARTDVRSNSAYETNLSRDGAAGDTIFTIAELERLLRYHDADAESLPNRILELTDAFDANSLQVPNRRAVTTDSYSMPVPSSLSPAHLQGALGGQSATIYDVLRQRMSAAIRSNASLTNAELQKILAPELARGVRMDVNRPFGNARDDNANGIVDEHGPTPTQQLEAGVAETIWGGSRVDHDNDGILGGDADAFQARQLFARHLYCLLMALRNPGKNFDTDGDGTPTFAETARALAQFSINVVDFRDPDSIMTPFEYDVDPFNGNGWVSTIDGNPGTIEGGDRDIVWGCERPELLISETLASHDRRTEPDGGMDGNEDQRLRPRGSFFVELYNPWRSDDLVPAEFYRNNSSVTTSGVVLNKRAPTGNRAPVWRLIVTDVPGNPEDPVPANRPTIERTIYMAASAGGTPPGPVVGRTYSTTRPVAVLEGGKYAVVGSAGQEIDHNGAAMDYDGDGVRDFVTTIGRLTTATEGGLLDYANTRAIVLEPSTNTSVHQVRIQNNGSPSPEPNPPGTAPQQIQAAIAVAVNRAWDAGTAANISESLNVSQPLSGYSNTGPGGELWDSTLADNEGAYAPAIAAPLDTAGALSTTGTTPGYKAVHLQRLANPLLPWDTNTNPYLTVDSMGVNLTAYNGLEANSTGFHTYERGQSTTPSRLLWAHQTMPAPGSATPGGGTHFFNSYVNNSLGYLNEPYGTRFSQTDVASSTITSDYIGSPNSMAGVGQPFPWLTWNNRPYVSEHELLQVPMTSSWELTNNYSVPTTATINPYGGVHKFGHLLNFFDTTHVDNAGLPVVGSDLYRVFDYLHVPSRFVGTETWLNPAVFDLGMGTEYLHPPFNRISQYRDPGKVNINTIFDDRVWKALFGRHGGSAPYYSPTFSELADSRRGYGAAGSGTAFFATDTPTLFANPFRSLDAGKLVPLDNMERAGSECSLVRSSTIRRAATSAPTEFETLPGTGPNDPLLDFASTAAHNHTDRNPFFRYQQIQRMANLVTTQSNVYAIWVTVGFFEIDPTTGRLGQEYGLDNGDVKRHRGFYTFDRSIPVAFEPGENHNIDQAILLRRLLE